MKLQNQVAIVTGGGSGIGRATSIMLAEQGANIVVFDPRTDGESANTITAIEKLGRKATLKQIDVTNDKQVSEAIAQVAKDCGRLDILINNAGTASMVPFKNLEGLTEEMWDKMYAVNVKGTFFCSRAAGRVMVPQGSGCIVNVSSMAGLVATGSSIAYAATKAAVVSLTKTMAIALAPKVRVNAVAPSFANTPWNAPRRDMYPRVAERSQLKRIAEPDEIAEVIVALVTHARYVTGQVVGVDGGAYLTA
jgi:3-oxoacyl-[acyl-carrier protein] reductase